MKTFPDMNLFHEPEYTEEGFIPYRHKGKTYSLWYGKTGGGDNPPALVLHGGPGGSHDNLVAFQALSEDRPVIFYDQLGCGNSQRPEDPSLWYPERFFSEVRSVRDFLGLKKYHLIGHSWGTTLATGFSHDHPEGIISLSLHSPILSFPKYIADIAPGLKEDLPDDYGKMIDECDLGGRARDELYEESVMSFVRKNVIRTWPFPGPMLRLREKKNHQIHDIMIQCDSELNILGNLRKLDVSGLLKDLNMPMLFTAGEYDLCTPVFTKWHSSFATDAEMHVIKNSAHMTPIDQPEEIIRLQKNFFLKTER